MFINLSNHPSLGWSQEQMQAAERFGEVVDLPFPQVEPAATASEVHKLADKCVSAIMDIADPAGLTVHIMGEMTLTYSIVTALCRLGVRCVASTTERRVTEVDGKKVSEFRFVQFREY